MSSFDVFLSGEEIDLVGLNEEIIENSNWYKWFNDEEITATMQKHYYPNTKNAQREFFQNEIENNRSKLQLGISYKKDDVLIGTISLNGINFINRACEISGFIGEKQYQNFKNYTEACKLLMSHAFNNLNMHRIYGGTMTPEIQTMFVRVLGFTKEGIHRESMYKNGEYHDVYLIGILRKEYYQKFGSYTSSN